VYLRNRTVKKALIALVFAVCLVASPGLSRIPGAPGTNTCEGRVEQKGLSNPSWYQIDDCSFDRGTPAGKAILDPCGVGNPCWIKSDGRWEVSRFYVKRLISARRIDKNPQANAKNYKMIEGEGNVPGAILTVKGTSEEFGIIIFCTKNPKEGVLELQLSTYVNTTAHVSPKVARLVKTSPDATKTLDLCINERCRSARWVHLDEGSDESGGPLAIESPVILGITHERIRFLGLSDPEDGTHYEFAGDVEGVLKRICGASRSFDPSDARPSTIKTRGRPSTRKIPSQPLPTGPR
jgi:hypothetical protein